ncbi:radical SAM protein [Corallococcus sp. M34]|uniref:radical SAM protein n=1 Tax=Citreicoccus inhibens TaxID=2849499 RepID=UPI001C247D26|nr:radical SAM protein [Citreicoccus inhibens]MBU8895660.1 radical SAM protein [Citreicoccus inhibens]
MHYDLHDGRILTWALEAHAATHCNLRCVQCCPLSPHLPAWTVSPERLGDELRTLARVLKPQVFKFTGGEPFLHPDLPALLDVARASGISEQFSVTTNGFLAQSAPDAVYERLDRMTLSVYSSRPLPERSIARITERCEQHGIYLTVKRIDAFQQLTPDSPWASEAQTREVFARCWLKTRCHLVHQGRFYLCTRPPHVETVVRREHPELPALSEVDGVSLDGPELLARMLGYLERETPLETCRRCLGSSGPWAPHAQLPRGAEQDRREG